MRILFVCTSRALCGGIQYHLLDLAGGLRDKGVTVSFLARREGTFKDRLIREGYTVYTVNREGFRKVSAPIQAIRAIQEDRPDIISVNREHDIIFTYYVLKAAGPILWKVPKLVTVMHTPTGRFLPMLKKYSGLIYTSEYTRNSFVNSGTMRNSNSEVIYHGIEQWDVDVEAKFDRNRKRKYFSDKRFPIIGMVGNMWKNQEELIDVTRFLVREYPRVTIALVGSGAYDHIENEAKKYNLEDNFVFTGAVDRNAIPDIFFDFDISISTHKNEGFGIVHIESLMCYTPVVAYNCGGQVEVLGKGGSLLVDGGPSEFARTVKKLLDDDDMRRDLGVEGRRLVEDRFSFAAMCQKHNDYYEKLMNV